MSQLDMREVEIRVYDGLDGGEVYMRLTHQPTGTIVASTGRVRHELRKSLEKMLTEMLSKPGVDYYGRPYEAYLKERAQ